MDLPLPPSYCTATYQHSSLGGSLTFEDFIPQLIENEYESFGVLVERGNIWLQQNPIYEVKTCESIEILPCESEESMSYFVSRKNIFGHIYKRGLRLWLVLRQKSDRRPPQKIGYYNLIPNIIESRQLLFDKFEKLNQLLERFNKSISNIIHGRIISIETQPMKVPFSSGFDPDRSTWTSGGSNRTNFIFVIRIFFECGMPTRDEIGIVDFMPEIKSKGGFCRQPRFEHFSDAIHQASQWCANQCGIRFCNAQSLEIKLKNDFYVDPQNMSYTESEFFPTIFVKILRVSYIKYFETIANPPSLLLTCKTIIPYRLKNELDSEYEDLLQVKERIKKWIQLTEARILSVETSVIRLKVGEADEHGIEVSRTCSSTGVDENWIYVFRLYLDGHYVEPSSHMLPPPLVQNEDFCIIS